MKKLFTLLSLLPVVSLSFGQAITITAADAPMPTAPYDLYEFNTGAIANPSVATAATWNYTSYIGTPTTLNYAPETDAFFTGAGSDVQLIAETKHLNASMLYFYDAKIDFNTTGVHENGIDIPEQLYDISALTGDAGDSLNIPAQRYIMSSPKKIFIYPMTANTAWSSDTRRYTNFSLTIASAGLMNAPSQHVWHTHRKDTIVGWGKMRVYTAGGPSIAYDVLMDKTGEYNIDSFFIGGSPAPAALLSGFGITQGQQNETYYKYFFLRKGDFLYLASIVYNGDLTYTNPSTLYINKNATTATGVDDVAGSQYTTVLFPNPATGNEINLMISGASVAAEQYYITDMLGRIVQTGAVQLKQGILNVPFNNNLPEGQYAITVTGNGTTIASEQFSIAK
jgi:hypothetical protein